METTHWWFCGRRTILSGLVGALAAPGTGRLVVEVGCGTGANSLAFAGGYAYVGIDQSALAVDLARKRFPEARFEVGTVPDALTGASREGAVYLLADVLEHVEADDVFMERLVSVIRPGTFVVVTVPADMRLWSPHDEAFGHRRRYDAAGLRATWASLPVRERLFSYYKSRLYIPIMVLRRLLRFRGRAAGRGGTDFAMMPGPLNEVLRRLFAGEKKRLESLLNGRSRGVCRHGVSLIAVLEKIG